MNKKQLFIAAVAAVLSVTSVSATDISGVAGSGNVFNINPDRVNDAVGYRSYENFTLDEGDIANLIYKYGTERDIETFINMVQNGVNINGILNTVRDGNFYNGKAIFITPGGMTVGASGVLNVGALSVATPTASAYNNLLTEYNNGNYTNINNVSNLLNRKENVGKIDIQGKVFAREGVQLRGGDVNISGAVINGVKELNALNSLTDATVLFNKLVNTDGLMNASEFTQNGTNIQIKSSTGTNVGGHVLNGAAVAGQANNGLYITNSGANGTTISGKVQSTNELNLYNKAGKLEVTGTVKNTGANLNISNTGTNLTAGGNITTDGDLAIVNNGTGKLLVSGTAVSTGKTDVVNEGAGGLEISGTLGNTAVPSVRIVNRGGEMVFTNTAKVVARDEVKVRNYNGTGLTVNGEVEANDLVSVINKKGDLLIGGKLSATDEGNVNVLNEGNALTFTGEINGNGNVALKNKGAGGMNVNGKITNEGETAINNENGLLTVDGTINNLGNMGIINDVNGTGVKIGDNAKITNEGTLKIKNNTGAQGTVISGDITNNSGKLRIYNNAGELAVTNKANGTGANIKNETGSLALYSRENSTGIRTESATNISTGAGYDLALKHNGVAAPGDKGMDLNGTIQGGGQTAINNYNGNMYVGGTVTSDGNLGIVNRDCGVAMTVDATVKSDTANINIKNYGSGDMTVNGNIEHTGRVNVLANSGKLNLGGTVKNDGNGELNDNNGFYAASRANGTGINVTEDFKAEGTGQNLIKNISGADGLTFAGNVQTSGAQTELYNLKGNMTVGGTIDTTTGNAVILNKGEKLTVNGTISSTNDVKVVNKGAIAADTTGATVNQPNAKWFYEKLK